MKNEIKRIVNNLNEVTISGKKNILIISDAIMTLERLYSEIDSEEVEPNEILNTES